MTDRRANQRTLPPAPLIRWWNTVGHSDANHLVFGENLADVVGREAMSNPLADDDIIFLDDDDIIFLDDDGLDPWGDDTRMIEDWFAAGEDLRRTESWAPLLADGWEDGVVLRHPRRSLHHSAAQGQ